MLSGNEYIAVMSLRESDRRAREAFIGRVAQLAHPGGFIFDFGCGPGIDAKIYAKRGYRVAAYDSDESMCETFARHCEAEIASGQITLLNAASYADFLSSSCTGLPLVDVLTANFAPLNLADDPQRLFVRFSQISRPGARILISVLNPYCRTDLRYLWWWRNLIPFLWRGYSQVGGPMPVTRRSPSRFKCVAEPHFTLRGAFPGLPNDARIDEVLPWWKLTASQYLFLYFEKK